MRGERFGLISLIGLVLADSAANVDLLPHSIRIHCRVFNDDEICNGKKVFFHAARQCLISRKRDPQGLEVEMRRGRRLLNSYIEIFGRRLDGFAIELIRRQRLEGAFPHLRPGIDVLVRLDPHPSRKSKDAARVGRPLPARCILRSSPTVYNQLGEKPWQRYTTL